MATNVPGRSGATRQSEVRAKMIEGAVRLLATRGVEGTSFAEVLELTNTPRGSVYHHFPGGKTELLHAALDYASEQATAGLGIKAEESVVAVVERFLRLWSQLLERSRATAGCAVVAVTVAPGDEHLLDHAGQIFRSWTETLGGLFVARGLDEDSARQLAVTVIAASEGAVALSRAERSRQPFDEVSTTLLALAGRMAPQGRPQPRNGVSTA
jgi:TetR/AcrR family transcriptional repressor of lmrAB and yxaGH operons